MRRICEFLGCVGIVFFSPITRAEIITVTTANNANPGASEMSLARALETASDGDAIRFNLPGAGPHYLLTPAGGYPEITSHNITIDGYSQPGAVPNANQILAPNNAQIKVILDSRGGGGTVLDYDGYSTSESAVLGIVGATNVTVRGLGFLGQIVENVSDSSPALYFVSFAKKATDGHVNGCWMGVDVDGTNVFGANAGVTGFRFNDAGVPFFSDRVTVGVGNETTNAPAQFNVFCGLKIPVIVEGSGLRVSGNFLNVLPIGTKDVNNALSGLPNEGAIQVGRDGNRTLIGTDGDGVNDENERNIFGGVLPRTIEPANGYRHLIEFYGGGERADVVIAGNYFGIGVDGKTRFTTGVPIVSGQTGNTRIGSDFDGVSDSIEGNWIFNNYPPDLLTKDTVVRDFLDGAGSGALISLRGNRLVNNFAPPINPLRDDGTFILTYYSKAILDVNAGVAPELSALSTVARLIGRVPVVETILYPTTIVDVYISDSEGMANSIPELADAFVQGSVYLGSFVEGSDDDLNPEPGAFEFSIRGLNLLEGDVVTVTANFSEDPAGTRNARTLTTPFALPVVLGEALAPAEPPVLVVSRDGNQVRVSWTGAGFVLQTADNIMGPWSNQVGAGNAAHLFIVEADGKERFFRLISQ
ncbi:MAG: hypothetical protein O2960_23555 [Verrucomicrobia bacterium]|nr:hypothetical protein [Verrucomicrobiota bacterium]